MTAEIGLLSMTQIQKLSQSQHHHHCHHHHQSRPQFPNPNSTISSSSSQSSTNWMWNPRGELHQEVEDDESWEVRAFAEDTRNIMAATWPPRSYTCTFCWREFRSAQALGGHMNVHRRDRARLHHHHHHQAYPSSIPTAAPSSSHRYPTPSSFISIPPPQEAVVANSTALCLLYHMPSPNNYYNNAPFTIHHGHNTALSKSPSSSLVSLSSYPHKNSAARPTCSPSSFDFPAAHQAANNGFSSSYCCGSSKAEEPSSSSELDLELRLGHKSPPN